MNEIVRVGIDEAGARLDKFVAMKFLAVSRSLAQSLIAEGLVWVDGRVCKANYRVGEGEAIRVSIPSPQPTAARGENIPLTIAYEDTTLLVVDKPAGMVVHPAAGHANGTLVNAVLGHAPDLVVGNAGRPGIVHRLDRDTSGLLVIAKNDAALKNLQQQFAARTVHKIYLALVDGQVAVTQGKIDAPLVRDPHDRKKFSVNSASNAHPAVTIFRVVEHLADYTLLQVELQTGRTHQIRVHLAFIHHPIVGDAVYGRKHKNTLGLTRQFLHAWRLGFVHPETGVAMEFNAPLPNDLRTALARAGGAID